MKKLLSLLVALMMILTLGACSSKTDETAGGEPAVSEEKAAYVVGIVQLVQHPALDAATQGFKDAIAASGLTVEFKEGNASGDSANCSTIVAGFLSDGVDLIMANATPALQAATAATSDVPILGTSVTDYATALDISDWTGTVGTNVSGTSDLAPLADQAAMIEELFPEAKNVGILYCSAEANSVYQATVMKSELEAKGYTVENYSFTDTNDVTAVTEKACEGSDVIYIPTDNAAASNTEAIANVVLNAGVPVVAGEEGICSGCGVATLSISYYDLGYQTGEMAAEVLKGGDISKMEIKYAPKVTKEYNAANAEAMGIAIPADYVAIEG